uniref:PLP-dependent transferase n=3 Tax=Rhizophagus irregularis TaxID=588596 RepID=U9U1M8_RHIID
MLAISGQRMAALEGGSNAISTSSDFEAICKVAHDVKIPVTVDNTSLINLILYIGRYFINPIEHGADIVYNRLWNNNRGIMIDGGKSPWNNGGFTIFTNPSSDYHGLIYWDIFGYNAFTTKARSEIMRNVGPCQNPFGSFLLIQGFEALSLRVHTVYTQAENVLELEKWFESRDDVL